MTYEYILKFSKMKQNLRTTNLKTEKRSIQIMYSRLKMYEKGRQKTHVSRF